ncbi:PREDICTED: non-specific lipid-transfer protein 2 [Tarenaya hassleriana]|uniref:non-specific lipid-transfer protein 2 n=1 Tax=Tarenaya hassleriana TaxID=28532 RepID=UPI0008FD3617|nr:PREDICTED: non-specific lipid-transfer protein 2 [Tarenaya hassleriana]
MKVSYKTPLVFTCAFLLLLLLLLGQETTMVDAQTQICNPLQLSPCLDTITKGSNPSKQCCSAVVKQKPCLCQYMKTPAFKSYLSSPNAKKVSTQCKVPFPKC